MKRLRLSIAAALGVVALLGLALAALHAESEPWAQGMLSFALASNGVALVGSLASRSPRKSAWTGFLVFGGGYLGLCVGPWASEHIMPHLVTTPAIDQIYDQLEYTPTRYGERVWTSDGSNRGFAAGETFGVIDARAASGVIDARTVRFDIVHDRGTTSRYVASQMRAISPSGHRILCHSILSLGIGLLGAWLIGWLREPESGERPPQATGPWHEGSSAA